MGKKWAHRRQEFIESNFGVKSESDKAAEDVPSLRRRKERVNSGRFPPSAQYFSVKTNFPLPPPHLSHPLLTSKKRCEPWLSWPSHTCIVPPDHLPLGFRLPGYLLAFQRNGWHETVAELQKNLEQDKLEEKNERFYVWNLITWV